MKKSTILSLLFLCYCLPLTQAQTTANPATLIQSQSLYQENNERYECRSEATEVDAAYERSIDRDAFNQQMEYYLHHSARETRNFLIQIHIVSRDDGTGGIPIASVRDEFENWVAPYFEPIDVTFTECGEPNYISSTAFYSLSGDAEGDNMAVTHNVPNVFNIYFVGDPDGACGWARFPWMLPADYIVIANECATNRSTLVHEIGHYFGLYHTHETAVGDGAENVTRSNADGCYNCDNAGDLLCDTDADPRLNRSGVSISAFPTCGYSSSLTDGCGVAYTPDETNIMSYSLKPCRTVFSPQQYARMQVYISIDRNYLLSVCPCDLPIAACKNITLPLNAAGTASITPASIDNGSTWDCGFGSWSVSTSSFTCANLGPNNVTLTITDEQGNVASCIAVVNVVDNIYPVALCQDVTIYLNSSGLASVTAAEVNNGSYDNCGIQSMSVSPSQFDCSNIGPNLVTLEVVDNSGNTSYCDATVTVAPKATTSLIAVSPDPQQYSDAVTFTATITDGASCAPESLAAESVTFYVGAQDMGSADFEVSGSDLVAILSDICLLDEVAGQMAPGLKTVSAEFHGLDESHYSVSQPDPISLTITPEDALVEYNGQEYFSTPSASNCTGTITLMAYIGDIDDTPVDCRGDIRNATLTFSNGGIPGTTLSVPDLPVGLINPGEFQEGVAVTDFMHTLTGSNCSSGGETFEVWVSAGGYYTGQTSDLTLVTLALPGSEFVTGGGHVVLGNNSAGTYAGTAGSKMNFGFNMKWNPSGKNLQGNINVIFRRYVNGEWRKYQIRSNKINSMAVSLAEPGYKKAVISTKATLKDITDPLSPISLGGNLNLALDAYENTTMPNGSLDKIVVTLSGNGGQGILFSSQWIGTRPVAQLINGGKIHVRSDGPPSKTGIAGEYSISDQESTKVKIRPNPFDSQTAIEFELTENLYTSLEIRDNSGRTLAVLHKGQLQAGQHTFTFEAAGLPAGVYHYLLISGNNVRSGKIVKMK
jgi:hypothetical protein